MNCLSAINTINTQLSLIYSYASNARYPGAEISTYDTIYNSYISQMNLTPRWYVMPEKSIPANGFTDIDLSSLGEVETLNIQAQSPALADYSSLPPSWWSDIFRAITFNIKLYINKDGNLSVYKSTTLSINSPNQTIYQGIKFTDKFRITSSYSGSVSFSSNPIIIKCSFLEKMTDLVWLYVNAYQE